MAARLGDVLYWAFCALAAVLAGLAAYIWATYRAPQDFVAVPIFATIAFGAWLVGRACRYILAAR